MKISDWTKNTHGDPYINREHKLKAPAVLTKTIGYENCTNNQAQIAKRTDHRNLR